MILKYSNNEHIQKWAYWPRSGFLRTGIIIKTAINLKLSQTKKIQVLIFRITFKSFKSNIYLFF